MRRNGHFSGFSFILSLVWLAAWRRLGDHNGWLALVNAWAWWLSMVIVPAGVWAIGPRSRLASLVWGIASVVVWVGRFGWSLPLGKKRAGLAQNGESRLASQALGDQSPTTRQRLSLLSFNLLKSNPDLSPALALVAQQKPDILLFQECVPSHATQLENNLAQTYPHRLWLPAAKYAMGFGIASKTPFALSGFWQYPGFEPFAARITLPLTLSDGDTPDELDIYCVQFVSPTNEVGRMGLTALLHLREQQIGWVLHEIESHQKAALVAGDWNSTEGSDTYAWATDRLVDGWREAGIGPGWSWPRRLNPYVNSLALPLLRLDYVMHTGSRFGPGLHMAQMKTIRDDLGSDHCPLLAKISIERDN